MQFKSFKHSDWENHTAWALSWWREFSEFWRHILSGYRVCNWGISVPPLVYTYRGFRGLLVVISSVAEHWLHKPGFPGFDSRQLLAFSLSSIFTSKHLNSLCYTHSLVNFQWSVNAPPNWKLPTVLEMLLLQWRKAMPVCANCLYLFRAPRAETPHTFLTHPFC